MRTSILSPNYLVMAILFGCLMCLTVLNGCKKDDPNDQPGAKSYRMKSFTYSSNNSEIYTTEIQYNAENKIIKIAKEKNGVEFERNDWSWNGNRVEISNSVLDNSGIWVNKGITQIITYANGKVSKTESPFNDSITYSVTYTWSGDLVTKEIYELRENGNLTWAMNNDYTYENNLLTSSTHTVAGVLAQKDIIEYEDGKLTGISSYDSDNKLIKTSAIIHIGNVISQVEKYYVEEGIKGDVECTETLAYDNNGSLNTLTWLCDGDEGVVTTQIVHEEGTGNYSDLTITNIGWLTYYLFPDSYDSPLIYLLK